MKKLVLGALNIDRTYSVEKLVRPKETIAAVKYESFCGGKGFNQAVALARAGSEVFIAGVIGYDGGMLFDTLHSDGINTDYIKNSVSPNGHAVIQVDRDGQNCIIIVAGSNAEITEDYIDKVLDDFAQGDLIVLQNEVPCVNYAIEEAKRRELFIIFNPSPIEDSVKSYGLDKVNMLIVNELEGAVLSGFESEADILENLKRKFPNLSILLTKGENGSVFLNENGMLFRTDAILCEAVDTTAAGDTFTGYFLDEYFKSHDPQKALRIASIAGGISVTRKGASSSIPYSGDVLKALNES